MGKRVFDFLVAAVCLVVIAPFVPCIALWIKATSPGPVIFRQVRIGYHGARFVLFKFRTMEDEEWCPFAMVMPGDTRVTTPGRFLRKTHMDELPQLVNVLLGQMSLIGPRPLQEEVIQRCVQELPAYERRLEVHPGMTGLVQIRGRMWLVKRGTRCGLRLDLFYVKHHCLWLDLYILYRTVLAVLRCEGV